MRRDRKQSAFTLIELLIVIGIIGLLIQLSLPAVQSAREAARKTQCAHHLRQVGLAVTSHESALRTLPTAGWGWDWIGDPDHGTGTNQPGSWAYQLLPYIGYGAVHDIGLGADILQKPYLTAELAATPVEVFYCPTRRPAVATPTRDTSTAPNGPAGPDFFWQNSVFPPLSARLDYAASMGDVFYPWDRGPRPEAILRNEHDDPNFIFVRGESGDGRVALANVTGVVVQRHPFRLRQITDGTTHTYFAVEKRIRSWAYDKGNVVNDDDSAWSGASRDSVVSSYWPPSRDPVSGVRDAPPADMWGLGKKAEPSGDRIGSAHQAGYNAAFCDGSVHFLDYDIDPRIHRYYGNRCDGEPVPSP